MLRSTGVVLMLWLAATSLGSDLSITSSIPGTFIDISTTGTPLGLADEGAAEILPGFDLAQTLFSGDGTGRVWVSNNGAIGFLADGTFGAMYWNQPLPSFSLFGGGHDTPQALAVYWDDLDADTGDVYYQTIGEPGMRVLVVEWLNRPHYPGDPVLDGDEATFEVQIFENAMPGYAQFLYQDVDFLSPTLNNGASATIGYQAGGHLTDAQWSFNVPDVVQAGTVLTILPPYALGDMNCDGTVDFGDINPFVLAISDPSGYAVAYPMCNILNGNMNCDGAFDFGDINPFVACLASGDCDCP